MHVTEIPASAPEREIISSRVFKHPKTKVFEAWRNPKYLKIWWGPKGFTNTFHVHQFEVGGHWKLTMHGPDQGHYENEAVFKLILPPDLIYWTRLTQPYFDVVATFETVGKDETKLTFRMVFPTEKDKSKVIKFVPDANEENFDRLEAVLNDMP